MANSNQARKRVRQAIRRRMRNKSMLTMYRTYLKRARKEIADGKELAAVAVAQFTRVADRISGKGIVSSNHTARLKSRLAASMRRAGIKHTLPESSA